VFSDSMISISIFSPSYAAACSGPVGFMPELGWQTFARMLQYKGLQTNSRKEHNSII